MGNTSSDLNELKEYYNIIAADLYLIKTSLLNKIDHNNIIINNKNHNDFRIDIRDFCQYIDIPFTPFIIKWLYTSKQLSNISYTLTSQILSFDIIVLDIYNLGTLTEEHLINYIFDIYSINSQNKTNLDTILSNNNNNNNNDHHHRDSFLFKMKEKLTSKNKKTKNKNRRLSGGVLGMTENIISTDMIRGMVQDVWGIYKTKSPHLIGSVLEILNDLEKNGKKWLTLDDFKEFILKARSFLRPLHFLRNIIHRELLDSSNTWIEMIHQRNQYFNYSYFNIFKALIDSKLINNSDIESPHSPKNIFFHALSNESFPINDERKSYTRKESVVNHDDNNKKNKITNKKKSPIKLHHSPPKYYIDNNNNNNNNNNKNNNNFQTIFGNSDEHFEHNKRKSPFDKREGSFDDLNNDLYFKYDPDYIEKVSPNNNKYMVKQDLDSLIKGASPKPLNHKNNNNNKLELSALDQYSQNIKLNDWTPGNTPNWRKRKNHADKAKNEYAGNISPSILKNKNNNNNINLDNILSNITPEKWSPGNTPDWRKRKPHATKERRKEFAGTLPKSSYHHEERNNIKNNNDMNINLDTMLSNITPEKWSPGSTPTWRKNKSKAEIERRKEFTGSLPKSPFYYESVNDDKNKNHINLNLDNVISNIPPEKWSPGNTPDWRKRKPRRTRERRNEIAGRLSRSPFQRETNNNNDDSELKLTIDLDNILSNLTSDKTFDPRERKSRPIKERRDENKLPKSPFYREAIYDNKKKKTNKNLDNILSDISPERWSPGNTPTWRKRKPRADKAKKEFGGKLSPSFLK